jgi:hypothetical protein
MWLITAAVLVALLTGKEPLWCARRQSCFVTASHASEAFSEGGFYQETSRSSPSGRAANGGSVMKVRVRYSFGFYRAQKMNCLSYTTKLPSAYWLHDVSISVAVIGDFVGVVGCANTKALHACWFLSLLPYRCNYFCTLAGFGVASGNCIIGYTGA